MKEFRFYSKCSLLFACIYATIMFLAVGGEIPVKWFCVWAISLIVLWIYILKVFKKEDWKKLFESKNETNGTE